MDWTNIKAGLKTLIASIAELPSAGSVEWQDSPEASAYRPIPSITLFARSEVGVGVDEIRHTVPDELGERETFIAGQRKFILVVKVESDNSDSMDARIFAGRVRARLRRKSSLTALRALGVCLAQVQSTVDTTYTLNGRKLSACITDINMNAVENDIDTTPGAGDWIEKAHIEGNKLTDEAGADVSPQPVIDVDATGT